MSETRKEIKLRTKRKTLRFKGFFNDEIVVTLNGKPLKRVGIITKKQKIYVNNIGYLKIHINFKKVVSWICKGWCPDLNTYPYIQNIFQHNMVTNNMKINNFTKKKETIINDLLTYIHKKNNL